MTPKPPTRDWFTIGKPMEPTPPILLTPTLYARAVASGADMHGYQVHRLIPTLRDSPHPRITNPRPSYWARGLGI